VLAGQPGDHPSGEALDVIHHAGGVAAALLV